MGSNLRSRFHVLIGLTGTLLFCAGVFILASGIVVRNVLKGLNNFHALGYNTCQYWAGIPVSHIYHTRVKTGFYLQAVFCRNW